MTPNEEIKAMYLCPQCHSSVFSIVITHDNELFINCLECEDFDAEVTEDFLGAIGEMGDCPCCAGQKEHQH